MNATRTASSTVSWGAPEARCTLRAAASLCQGRRGPRSCPQPRPRDRYRRRFEYHRTATPGGGFPVYGDAVAAVINEIDDSLHVEPRNTKGSTENVPLLEAGQLDIALVQGEVVHEVLNGIDRFPASLCVLSAM
ncbi:MAG: TAXI family TRAP transporter solute-binding subunit [Candidatus Rokuibacteriota bacterium]